MSMTRSEAEGLTATFLKAYPVGYNLAFRFRQNTAELYGDKASLVPDTMKGGYTSREIEFQGRTYQGLVDIALDNITDARDLQETLRHEVLGHYALNTFSAEDKSLLLQGVAETQNDPSLAMLWERVNRDYSHLPLEKRSEEVYAAYAETIAPLHHKQIGVSERGERAFSEACVDGQRAMDADDLKNISYMVAQGLHNRTRQQLNFPVRETHLSAKKIEAPVKVSYQDQVAEKIIKHLEAGTAPWQRPWGDASESALPMNPVSGNRYKGINAVQLLSESRADPRWLTYKQTQDLGAQVRKGEKGTVIQYWQFPDKGENNTATSKPESVDEKKQYLPFVKHFVVFNAEQIDGLPPLEVKVPTWDVVARADNILQASGADIRHAEQERAVYMPKADYILLPNKTQFADSHLYYATALHELSHWTGHESRLARDLSGDRSSENYAREELRAEISSMLMGAEVGLGHDPSNHLSYVASWVKAIKSDPAVIFKAAADAEKIQTFLLAKELEFNAKKQLTTKEPAPSLVAAHKLAVGLVPKNPYVAGKEAHAQRSKPTIQAKPLQPSKGLKI